MSELSISGLKAAFFDNKNPAHVAAAERLDIATSSKGENESDAMENPFEESEEPMTRRSLLAWMAGNKNRRVIGIHENDGSNPDDWRGFLNLWRHDRATKNRLAWLHKHGILPENYESIEGNFAHPGLTDEEYAQLAGPEIKLALSKYFKYQAEINPTLNIAVVRFIGEEDEYPDKEACLNGGFIDTLRRENYERPSSLKNLDQNGDRVLIAYSPHRHNRPIHPGSGMGRT